MNITDLEYFVSIAETMSFSQAAEKNYISASSISKAIKALEDELGVTLFQRTNRKIAITEAGEYFLTYARASLNSYYDMIAGMRAFASSEESTIRIATLRVAFPYHIMASVYRFQKKYPEITVLVEEKLSGEIMDSLHKSAADFGINRTNHLDRDAYQVFPLLDDKFVAILMEDHPLYDRDRVSLRDFYNKDHMILPTPQSGLYQIYKDAYESIGLALPEPDLDGTYEAYFGLLWHVTTSGIFMDKAIPRPLQPGVRVVPLEETITSETALICLREKKLKPHEKCFLEFMKSERESGAF